MNDKAITIITPCFNENATVIVFLRNLEAVVKDLPFEFTIVIVDDASTDHTLELLKELVLPAANVTLKILSLKFNNGHQGAIYQGLLYAKDLDCDKFIVMDSDGEDDPAAITELVTITDYDIVNVVRGQRKESLSFQVSYYAYRLIFKMITGKTLNFGNYCMISKRVLITSGYTSFIHFAAHLSKLKVSCKGITYDRQKRINGKSKMNLTSLVHHAFKSFVEYAEELLSIFLKIFVVIAVIFIGLMAVVIYKKLFTDEAILGWASTLSASLFNMALISLGFFVIGILLLNIMAKREKTRYGIYDEIT